MESKVMFVKDLKKSCGACTACCSGALRGEAHGHHFYKGRPCFFLTEKGCGIYENRPESPCVTYKCGYLAEPFFPEWMRPDLSGALATPRVHEYVEDNETKHIPYMYVMEYGRPLSGKALMWFVEKYFAGDIPNLLIDIEGGVHKIGRPDFLRAMG